MPVGNAVAAGTSATQRFKTDKTGTHAGIPPERVGSMVGELLDSIRSIVNKYEVTYAEYNFLKAWLIKVGEDGEWPLFLDVWIESMIEDVAFADRRGSKGSIEGPYFVPDAPEVGSRGSLPTRDDEAGTPLLLRGRVSSTDRHPLADAKVEMWHADCLGLYSQFEPDIPRWNLRGTISVEADGSFEVATIRPAAYEIPTAGACGQLVRAAGWHAWRPAHLHFKVSAPGHEPLTTQLYLRGDAHTDDDVASAVKDELLLDPEPTSDGGQAISYHFTLDPAQA